MFGSGKPLFFLPGAGASTHYYAKTLQLLAENHKIIALNYPGFDKTPLLHAVPNLQLYCTIFAQAIKRFNLAENNILAHSMGSGIALEIDRTNPGLLNKAVLVAPLLETYSGPAWSLALKVIKSYRNAFNKVGSLMEVPQEIFTEHLRDIPEMYRQLLLASHNFGPVLHEALYAKKLLIHGRGDSLFSLERQLELSYTIPNALTVIENGGHEILFTNYESLMRRITEFLLDKV